MQVRVVMEPGAEGRFQAVCHAITGQVAQAIAADMRASAPVRTGELRRSIHVTGGTIRISAPQWVWNEYGTRPHPIMAGAYYSPPHGRGKKALWWPQASHPVRSVHHPGTPAQPFIRPAVYRARSLHPVGV